MRIERKSKSLCYYIAKYIFVLLPLLLLLGGVLFPNHTINNIYALDDEVLISTSSSYNTELSIVSTSENTSTSQDISSSESISSDVSSSDNVVSNSVRLGYHDTYSLNVNDVNFDYFYAFDISLFIAYLI